MTAPRASRVVSVRTALCLLALACLLAVAAPAWATGGKIETPTSGTTVGQPFVVSGWAVGFRCGASLPQPDWVCRWDGSAVPASHPLAVDQATWLGCSGWQAPGWVCVWNVTWFPASHPTALQQAGNPADGPGVDRVEIWTCPTACTGSNATFRGVATLGLSRPDIVALTGASRFANSGFSYTLTGLAGGQYEVQVRMRSAFYGSSWNTTSVTVTVPTGQPHMAIESPAPNAGVAQPFSVNGWAIDAGAPSGVGVDQVHVWANKDPGSGTAAAFWGSATLGGSRPTVGQTYGSQFTNSGYTLSVTGQPPGWYVGGVFAHSTVTGVWQATAMNLYVDIPTVSLTIDRQGAGTGGVSAAGLSCPGGSSTQAVPCGASYTQGTVVTLTAVPDVGSAFASWGGACAGSGACQVTMATVRFVTATFTAAPTSTTVATYYHTDAIGSVRAITDEAGATVIRHDYLPFGEDTQPLAGDPMRFAGKELDPESAQEYFGARYYRNVFGRFGTPDPVGGSLTNPQSWNGYAYAQNNPLRYIDPTGMYSENPCGENANYGCEDTEEYFCYVNGCGQHNAMSSFQQEAYDGYVGMVDAVWAGMQAAQGPPPGPPPPGGAGEPAPGDEGLQEPPTAVSVLGATIPISYSPTLTPKEKIAAGTAIAKGAALLNTNAKSFTDLDAKAIWQISSISVIPRGGYSGATGGGSMTLTTTYIGTLSPAGMGSMFGHEGQHYLNAGVYSGSNLWRSEQSATMTQLSIGQKIGFRDAEITALEEWSRNPAAMQEHMLRGNRY